MTIDTSNADLLRRAEQAEYRLSKALWLLDKALAYAPGVRERIVSAVVLRDHDAAPVREDLPTVNFADGADMDTLTSVLRGWAVEVRVEGVTYCGILAGLDSVPSPGQGGGSVSCLVLDPTWDEDAQDYASAEALIDTDLITTITIL